MTNVLTVRDVSLVRDGTPVLDQLSFELGEGDVLAVLGPSGAGKSTLLQVILGFLAPDSGDVLLRGKKVSERGQVLVEPRRRKLAVVFQDLALWPHMTVARNLEFGLQDVSADERKQRVGSMLERVGLGKYAERYPGQLSGGQRQRVAIARALVVEPDAVLMDEPLSSLDIVLRQELLDLFSNLFRESGSSVLFISHDPWEASRLADRVLVLERGRGVFDGSMEDITSSHSSAFVARIAELMRERRR